MNFVEKAISQAREIIPTPEQQKLIVGIVHAIDNFNYPSDLDLNVQKNYRHMVLGAAFDLLVAAAYYGHVGHMNWLYCPEPDNTPLLFYPYTNACPHCILEGKFRYHKCHKPESGSIGKITRDLLVFFMQALLVRKGHSIRVLVGKEPVDTIFLDVGVEPPLALFAEVKSAPLLTPALVTPTEYLTEQKDEATVRVQAHLDLPLPQLYAAMLSMAIPKLVLDKENDPSSVKWIMEYFPLGKKHDQKDEQWAYRGMAELLENDPHFFSTFVNYWIRSFEAYSVRNVTTPIFWFTNACGQPLVLCPIFTPCVILRTICSRLKI